MKRIFNDRPLLFFALSLAFGIVLGLFCADSTALKIAAAASFTVLSAVFLFIKQTRKFFYIPLAVVIGAVAFFTAKAVYLNNSVNAVDAEFTATVASEIDVANGTETSFTVKNIYLDGRKLDGNARIYLESDGVFDFNAGDTVKISGSLCSDEFLPLDRYFPSSYLKRSTKFCFASSVEKIAESNQDVILAIEMRVKKAFFQNTKYDTASVCVSLIYGDKSGINSALYNDIKVSGLAHLLAVSGTHVAILAGAVAFLLKKLKVNKKLSAAVVICALFIYALFCGFSPSITRAFIMSTVFLLAYAFGKKPDAVSNLSFAAILILIISPVALFDVGFQLSFAAVAGIILFFRSFDKLFKRTGKIVSPLLATNFSANFMTYPIVARSFGVVPVFSALTNLIVLPFMSVLFVALLVSAVFVAIVPYSAFLMLFDYILMPFKALVFTVGSFEISSLSVPSLGIFAFAYYAVGVLFSRFVFLQKKNKIAAASAVTSVCAVLSLLI